MTETVRHLVALDKVVTLLVFIVNANDCKQSYETTDNYLGFLYDRIGIGVLFRSLLSNEVFWKGDVCIYLGTDGLTDPFKRLWCFRNKKYVYVDSFANFQLFGVTNYPGKRFANIGLQ
jgi:hypothetical protein